jgi:hypothetical protein
MSRPRLVLALLILLIAATAAAQTRIDAGLSVGQQAYAAQEDDPRYLPGVELLFRRGVWGGQLAADYADLSAAEGPLVAIHTNVVRRFGSDRWFATIGGGPTWIWRNSPKDVTWNAAGEVGHAWNRVEVFARLRHYDYELPSFRAGDAGPDGPAFHLGMRFRLHE